MLPNRNRAQRKIKKRNVKYFLLAQVFTFLIFSCHVHVHVYVCTHIYFFNAVSAYDDDVYYADAYAFEFEFEF